MTLQKIKFGTDGWRAIIGKDFVPENIERVIQAFCDWQKETDDHNQRIVVGFDRRDASSETAILVSEILAGNGSTILLSDQYCPTPCISWMTKNRKAAAGIMVTASHNPWDWNGIKFKEAYGGSASPAYTAEIEQRIEGVGSIRKMDFREAEKKVLVTRFSPREDYRAQLGRLADLKAIQRKGFRVVYDSMHGAGSGFLSGLLPNQIEEMNAGAPQESIPKTSPEPTEKNLSDLILKVEKGEGDVGLATDGDADRIAAIDENGRYVSPQDIFALLLKHYVEHKKLKGTVIKSVSTTQMISLLCKKYGLPLIETPIGFKHICSELVKHDSLMGGEESGGLSFAPHIHERDGLLNGLFLLEMMTVKKKKLGALLEELRTEIGTFHFQRVDCHLEKDAIETMQKELRLKKIGRLAGQSVSSTNFIDGFKYILADNSWLLVRASGTEPLVRIYAESPEEDGVTRLLEEGKKVARIT